jgi:DNA uptake protein ComE-like DNA-binding protein
MPRNSPERNLNLTTGERSALRWLTAVAVLGAGAQLVQHWRHSVDATPLSTEALALQLVAVDSAQRAGRHGRGRGSNGGGVGGGSQSRPSRGARRSATADSGVTESAMSTASGAERDTPGRRAGRGTRRTADRNGAAKLPTLEPVDLDRADSALLQRLPRIGPALAARIVADRQTKGPFGSLHGFERVRGIGPKLAQSLATLVTFSGIPRPSPVQR